MQDDHPIWIFTPSRTSPEDLEFILVQRQQLLQDAVERVKESALTGNKHHQLFVGPRGCGKTHLATLIVHKVSKEPELADRLRIAWLNEDESSDSLLDFLLRIHSALIKRYPTDYSEEQIAPVYEKKAAEALDFVKSLLLGSLGQRTLIVVVENLDLIFEGLKEKGQKQLRSFIQENPRLCIVATAQRLTEGLSKRDNPFFGFFQTEHLKPLNVQEATQLLQKIVGLDKSKSKVVQFLSTSRGRARVRALHHLSGGNHRIYIVLSQFITGDNVEALVAPFMKMVDELTPYYQERLRSLPPLQRRIIEYLCNCERTVPVKDIAKRLFATPPTISSQLQDLREKGYADSSQRGRESLYEISEPLMRICVEVKDNQRLGPLRLLVDFLRVWYDDKDLEHRLSLATCSPLGRAYLEAAIKRNQSEGNLRKKWLLHDLRDELPRSLSEGHRDQLLRICDAVPEVAAHALEQFAQGSSDEAFRLFKEAISEAATPEDKAGFLLCRADLHHVLGQIREQIDDLSAAILLDGATSAQMALALFSRSDAYGTQGNTQQAIDDLTQVTGLKGISADVVAMALFNRGITFAESGGKQRAINDFTQIIDLAGISVEVAAKTLFYRGLVFEELGEDERAINDFTQIIDLTGAPVEQVAMALVKRGLVIAKAGENQRAIEDYTRVIDLADASVEQIAVALFNRGVAFEELRERRRAIADYTQLIELAGAPLEGVIMALINRGAAFDPEDTQRAIDDFTRVIDMADSPVERVAMALGNRGGAYEELGERRRAIDDYTQVIGLVGAPVEQIAMALTERGSAFKDLGETQQAIDDYTQVIGLVGAPVEQIAMALTERGSVFKELGDTQRAIDDYTQVIGLVDAPVEQVVGALIKRGIVFGHSKENQQAIDDYTQVISLADAPVEGVAMALISRGLIFVQLGEKERAIEDCTQAIGLADAPEKLVADARYFRALIFLHAEQQQKARLDFEYLLNTTELSPVMRMDSHVLLAAIHWNEGGWNEGLALLAKGLKPNTEAGISFTGSVEVLIRVLFAAGLPPQARCDQTRCLFDLSREQSWLPALGESLASHLGTVYKNGTPFPSADNLEQWYTAWESAGAGEDEFKLPLRLLRTGIDFIKTGGKDMGVLLDLTSPERTLMKQALGLAEPED